MVLNIFVKGISVFIGKNQKKKSQLKSQQWITYLVYSLAAFVLLAANLFGLSGPQEPLALLFNALFMLFIILSFIACRFNKLSVQKTFAILLVIAHFFTCNEMLLFARNLTDYGLMLILGNVTLLAVNIMFSLMGYLRYISYVLSGMAMATYVACLYITHNSFLQNFSVIFLLMFLLLALLGGLLVKNTQQLDMENTEIKKEEKDLFDVLNMKKEEVQTYVRLAQQRKTPMEVNNILDILDTEARRNVLDNVTEAVALKEMEHADLSQIFPELTPSEIEICRLVILGKGLKEVCRELGKAESNVTSQRRHIRIKLGLQPSENLKAVLQARFIERKHG